jgi:REP element-mobilizing transposase RayT
MEKFNNQYRIPSARLPHWDYRWAGAYFITICTHNREHYFGEIKNGQMQLSHIGVIADILWYQIPHHSKNVELGAFVVMPNHVHGILILTDTNDTVETLHVETLHVETLHATSLPSTKPSTKPSTEQKNEQMAVISPKSNSISTIVRSYKSAVTKHAYRLGFDFQWQTRFHDHVIRNDESFQKITNYIISNPANWQDDKFYKAEA